MTRSQRRHCPICDELMIITDSRLNVDETIRRRRYRCPICGHRETIEANPEMVITQPHAFENTVGAHWHRDDHDVWTLYV